MSGAEPSGPSSPPAGRACAWGARSRACRWRVSPILRWTLDVLEATPVIARVVVAVPVEDVETWRRELAACPEGARGRGRRRRAPGFGPDRAGVGAGRRAVGRGPRRRAPVHHPGLVERVVAAAQAHGAAIAALPVSETVSGRRTAGLRRRSSGTGCGRCRRRRSSARISCARPIGARRLRGPRDRRRRPGRAPGRPRPARDRAGRHVRSPAPRTCPGGGAAGAAGRPMTGTRVGLGFDVHPFVTGRPLVLGGVEIPADRGLAGHSDADALSHAVADALLGALALGDLGRHFPDPHPQVPRSLQPGPPRRGRAPPRAAGGAVVNVDATVVAEAPRLAAPARRDAGAPGGDAGPRARSASASRPSARKGWALSAGTRASRPWRSRSSRFAVAGGAPPDG